MVQVFDFTSFAETKKNRVKNKSHYSEVIALEFLASDVFTTV